MALKKCRECGDNVSTKAALCPKCGAPVKKPRSLISSAGCGCLVILIAVVIVAVMVSDPGGPPRPAPPPRPLDIAPRVAEPVPELPDGEPEPGPAEFSNEFSDEFREYLQTKRSELDGFRLMKSFREAGFGGNPHARTWLQSLEEARDETPERSFENSALSELIMLGMGYQSSKGAETAYTRFLRRQLNHAIREGEHSQVDSGPVREAEEKRVADEEKRVAAEGVRRNLDRFMDALGSAGIDRSIVESVRVEGNRATITVANDWHLSAYQIRLQAAQNLWRLWASIASPDELDSARITLVDYNGNEVGGSRILGGSLIWVSEN